jgi:putative heme-binding domain-containing protein
VTPQQDPDLATGLIECLSGSEAAAVGPALTDAFASFTPNARTAAVAVLLKRPAWTQTLLAALDAGSIQLTELSLDQRQALANFPDRAIRGAARRLLDRGGALPSPDRQKVIDALQAVAESKGDSVAGKAVFTKVCAKCHMHHGEGNKIGPDLTGMAVHPKHELLMQVLDPNRSVESNFRTYTVITHDGLVLTGMLASESKTAIELFDAEGEKKTVLREDVDELIASTKSLMPEGFEKQVSEIEMRDLLEFLTQRGRYVPVDLTKAATASSDRGMFYQRDSQAERLVFETWGLQTFQGVPFNVLDPRDGRVPNVILLQSPNGDVTRRMPRSVSVLAGGPAKAIHLLSGVAGWGFPYSPQGSVAVVVRIHYADGQTEEHPLLNGEHFADYIRVVDVPQSQLAFRLRGRQIRYIRIEPQRSEGIETIEFAKGADQTAPVIMAVTLESQ